MLKIVELIEALLYLRENKCYSMSDLYQGPQKGSIIDRNAAFIMASDLPTLGVSLSAVLIN
jgi:hypothetical protein